VKKLAIIFLSVAFTGGVALACPHEEAEKAKEAAPKTAEKAKEADKAKTPEKAKEADKAKTAKPAKPAEKKPADKVSQK
jgi:hypothetical protein